MCDGSCLARFIWQILFLSGLTLIIGPTKTFYFFARKNKLRGSICFLGGIILVFLKWPFVGMIVETFGFLNLFGCVAFLCLSDQDSDLQLPLLFPRPFFFAHLVTSSRLC